MKGTFNAFGQFGVVVEDPSWVLRYEDEAFGGSGRIDGETVDWVVYATEHIPFGDVPAFLAEHQPVVTLEHRASKSDWQYIDGEWERVE